MTQALILGSLLTCLRPITCGYGYRTFRDKAFRVGVIKDLTSITPFIRYQQPVRMQSPLRDREVGAGEGCSRHVLQRCQGYKVSTGTAAIRIDANLSAAAHLL